MILRLFVGHLSSGSFRQVLLLGKKTLSIDISDDLYSKDERPFPTLGGVVETHIDVPSPHLGGVVETYVDVPSPHLGGVVETYVLKELARLPWYYVNHIVD